MWRDSMSGPPLLVKTWGKEAFHKNRRHEPSTCVPLELGEFLCFNIYSASHAFNRVYQTAAEGTRSDVRTGGLSPSFCYGTRTIKRLESLAKALSALEYPDPNAEAAATLQNLCAGEDHGEGRLWNDAVSRRLRRWRRGRP